MRERRQKGLQLRRPTSFRQRWEGEGILAKKCRLQAVLLKKGTTQNKPW